MWRFLLFVIFIILIQRLTRVLQEQQKEEQREPAKEKINELFKTLGFPLPEETPPEPKSERLESPKEPVIVKKEIKKPEVEIAEFKPTKIEPPPKRTEEEEEELPAFSTDKLEEGIVLSEILGPPKAYQIRRGGGIG